MHPILRKFNGGDRRSIGRSNEVVSDVSDGLAAPKLFDVVFAGLLSDDPLVRIRLRELVITGTPARKARGRKRLAGLAGSSDARTAGRRAGKRGVSRQPPGRYPQ